MWVRSKAFLNKKVIFFTKGSYWGDHGYNRGDGYDQKAKKAYEAMLKVALYQPNSTEFQEFSQNVKKRALEKYNFTFGQEKVIFSSHTCNIT